MLLNMFLELTKSTSTVGLPRESKIWRALIDLIGILNVKFANLLIKINQLETN